MFRNSTQAKPATHGLPHAISCNDLQRHLSTPRPLPLHCSQHPRGQKTSATIDLQSSASNIEFVFKCSDTSTADPSTYKHNVKCCNNTQAKPATKCLPHIITYKDVGSPGPGRSESGVQVDPAVPTSAPAVPSFWVPWLASLPWRASKACRRPEPDTQCQHLMRLPHSPDRTRVACMSHAGRRER